jgi:formamidopyrimidine-DNA glycosylase
MPELPEVETIRRGLLKMLGQGGVIEKIHVSGKNLRCSVPLNRLRSLEGETLLGIRRRAKYLLFETSQHILLNHLGMTGSWRLMEVSAVENKGSNEKSKPLEAAHDHLCIRFVDGPTIVYRDPRRFGLVDVFKKGFETQSCYLSHLGPEPLAKDFSGSVLFESSRGKKCSIKAFIMDQKIVVGVGNIYASESLHLAGIHPGRPAGRVSLIRYQKLHGAIVKTLRSAINQGGSTISDFRQAGGGIGYFQTQLKVYGRAQEPCRLCGTLIRVAVLAGRSTYWCSQCQH